jgi:hypothetical protein
VIVFNITDLPLPNMLANMVRELNHRYSNLSPVLLSFGHTSPGAAAHYDYEKKLIVVSDISLFNEGFSVSIWRTTVLHEFRHHMQHCLPVFDSKILHTYHSEKISYVLMEKDASEWAGIEFTKHYAIGSDEDFEAFCSCAVNEESLAEDFVERNVKGAA